MPDKPIQELLGSLSKKFYAKLLRIADECKTEPAVVLNEGAELFRRRYRLMNGILANRSFTPEQLESFSLVQSETARLSAARMGQEARSKRALAGAMGRIKKLKAKAKKPSGTTETQR